MVKVRLVFRASIGSTVVFMIHMSYVTLFCHLDTMHWFQGFSASTINRNHVRVVVVRADQTVVIGLAADSGGSKISFG